MPWIFIGNGYTIYSLEISFVINFVIYAYKIGLFIDSSISVGGSNPRT